MSNSRDRTERLQKLLAVARGEVPADVVFAGGWLVNVFSGELERRNLAVFDGLIAGIGDYKSREVVDVNGACLSPGFIEGHIHIESSKLTPPCFAEAVMPRGTCTVIADPHEIANVMGLDGIRFMLEQSRGLPLDILYMLPSCVPATDMETAGAVLDAASLSELMNEPGILGIGEMMNFPGAYLGVPEVLKKLQLAAGRMPVDGHAPGLSGKNLAAYIASGPATDHECLTLQEAREKLALGMRVMLREGSTARNLLDLLPVVTPATERRCMFVSDDRRPGDLLTGGHLDHHLRLAVAHGLDAVTALRMITLNPAETFGLKDRGGFKPGWLADVVVLDDLKEFRVRQVWKRGRLVARDGAMTVAIKTATGSGLVGGCNVPSLSAALLQVPDHGGDVRVIRLVPDQIVTAQTRARLPESNGFLQSDTAADIVKLAVVERYTGRGGTGVGFLQGMGLQRGALASTVAHDSHNIICAGVDDESMLTAVGRLVELGGGQVVTDGRKVLAELPLPVAGLMSREGAVKVAQAEEKLISAARRLGCVPADPFMALSFLALPVIPELKLTDKGLVDVNEFALVSTYIEPEPS